MAMEEASDCEREVFLGFLEESLESLDGIGAMFIKLERDPGNDDVINAIFRPVHSLKGNAPFFGLMKIKTLAHELESLLVLVRSKKLRAGKTIVDHLLRGTDELKEMVERVRGGGEEVVNETRFTQLVEQTKQLAAGSGNAVEDAAIGCQNDSDHHLETSAETAPEGSGEPKKRLVAGDAAKHMRVPEERIDAFLEFVGEFIIVGETLRHLISRLDETPAERTLKRDFIELQAVFSRLLGGLEKSIMSIRKVSTKGLLQKVPRLVRDVAAAKGKDILVEIEGDDVEVDKSLLELLDAPLTHMARNAADHGIEPADTREANGKSKQGRILVRCEEQERAIVLSVQDDGGGLNYPALQAKAESLGLIPVGTALEPEDVVNLLFMAGVSTAQEVSDISGRGVGMDVVKRAIEDAGGSITVESERGKGTKFSVSLRKSVTTQIVHGFVVAVGANYYALPSEKIRESWCMKRDSQTNIVGKGMCVTRHGSTRRVLALSDALGLEFQREPAANELVVTVSVGGGEEVVLIVDEVIGLRQLVLREIDDSVNKQGCFTGVTIMGDGKLALVLDMKAFSDAVTGANARATSDKLCRLSLPVEEMAAA